MGVYVDDMELPADVPNGSKVVSDKWSHLTADTHEELMEAAKALRLNPRWIQHPGTPLEHFDLTSGKRAQAIGKGIAEPISYGDSGRLVHAKREGEKYAKAKGVQRMSAQDYDTKAGNLLKDGKYTEARKVLGEALQQYPGDKDKWHDRLAMVSAKDPATKDVAAAIAVLRQANMLPPEKAQPVRPEPPSIPPVGIHREGGTTTRGMFGESERAPEPETPHPCPECSVTDDKGRTRGPQVEAGREACQSCTLQASRDLSKVPAHPGSGEPYVSGKPCAKCGIEEPGPGGILGEKCKEAIEHPRREPVALVVREQREAS